MEVVTKSQYEHMIKRLFELSSGKDFIDFSQKIINTQKPIIGVRAPALRKLAKEICRLDHQGIFIYSMDRYYEEILLKGFVIASIKEQAEAIDRLEEFYNKMDNWAVVDMVAGSLKFCKSPKNREENFKYFCGLLKSENQFKARFGIVALMKFFIDKEYIDRTLKAIDSTTCEKYYVNMAKAWLISEYIIKNSQNALEIMQNIVKNMHFNTFVINKSIQKACDSFRIDNQIKTKLKELKVR